jgi:hypothetical protein
MNKKLEEVIEFNHKGVNIYVSLNYEEGTVSFMDKMGNGNFDRKNWYFTDRTIDYLGGWYIIFEAMQKATEFADKELRTQAKLRESEKEQKMFDLMVSLSDIESRAKPTN